MDIINLKNKNDKKKLTMIHKVALNEKISGAIGAFQRIKERVKNEGKEALWADEKEIIERQVCCTTCTEGITCPYCGCGIKRRWFFPLGKSELTTEGCPSPANYPKLSKYPPRNYWQVCQESTTAVMLILECETIENINNTIKSLVDEATGLLEIVLILDGCEKLGIISEYKGIQINIHKNEQRLGCRVSLNKAIDIANTKYIFKIDAHCKLNYGWDTKLKCITDDYTISVAALGSLNPDWTYKENSAFYKNIIINEKMEEKWSKEIDSNKKIEEIMTITGCGFMLTKNGFIDNIGRLNENLAKWGALGPELTIKMYRAGGKALIRKDVHCYHIFNTNKEGYSIKERDNTRNYLLSQYKKDLTSLQIKFNIISQDNVDSKNEQNIVMNKEVKDEEHIDLEKIEKRDIIETKDTNGDVIKKVIIFYEPVFYGGQLDTSIEENRLKIASTAQIKEIRVAEKINNKWNYKYLKNQDEIEMWKFENLKGD